MADNKTKLYELVAAREDRSKAAKASVLETTSHLKQKSGDLFAGHVKVQKSLSEARSIELDAFEEKVCPTSVREKLKYTFDLIATHFNVSGSVDSTNGVALGDIIVDGKVIAEKVPVPTLLAIEKHLRSEMLPMLMAAPTLSSGTAWELDPTKGPNIYKTKTPNVKNKEEKGWLVLTLAPATDKFPAQVSKEVKTEVVATITETQWSGMIPSQEKADMIARVEELLIAVVTARNRANDCVANELKIGKALMDYILG